MAVEEASEGAALDGVALAMAVTATASEEAAEAAMVEAVTGIAPAINGGKGQGVVVGGGGDGGG